MVKTKGVTLSFVRDDDQYEVEMETDKTGNTCVTIRKNGDQWITGLTVEDLKHVLEVFEKELKV